MAGDPVTVAIPVLNGGPRLREVLRAVRDQRVGQPVELLVADSESSDGSKQLAQDMGATVIDVRRETFSHGGTRNLLVERSGGTHIAFLTQDSAPADDRWLQRLLEAFELADDVALVFGPYRARPEASPMVRRELGEFFDSFAPDGRPHLDRAGSPNEGLEPGRRAYFTNANGCILRAAWEQVPFRSVPYAEDHVLAQDMLAAGYAKAYHPGAAVVHSHDYSPLGLFRRSFDESRALHDVHGYVAPIGPVRTGLMVQRHVRDDLDFMRDEGVSGAGLVRGVAASFRYHAMRLAGAVMGSRAERLPGFLRRRCSLEGREA
jgi:glycosyltransferase involved in cell wall biosynthesis